MVAKEREREMGKNKYRLHALIFSRNTIFLMGVLVE